MAKMLRRVVGAGVIGAGLMLPMASASAFEPPSDPHNTFACVNGEPVPGHPGFPGIATGLNQSFTNTEGQALAAWSAVFKGNGTITLC